MRTLASFIIVSLDGFQSGPEGQFDWAIVDEEFREFAIRQLDESDTLGFGRATYEHMAAFWPTEEAKVGDPEISSRMNDKPKLVFSNSLDDASWSSSSLVSGDAVEKMEEIKRGPGGDLLIIGSAHLTGSFVAAGVLDELRIMISPIVLGHGRSLFEDVPERVALSLSTVRQFDSGNTLLTYRLAP